jgi:cation transport protein ChaC
MEPSIEIPVGLRSIPWSDDRRRAHLEETIARAPDPDAIWVFGYGSLIWDPRFEPLETRDATLEAHRRSFCFWTTMGRGTPEKPGLGLAIVPGGGPVQGLAYKLDPTSADDVLEALWLREMRSGVYHAEWKQIETPGGDVHAIVYIANDDHPNYAGDLALEDQARIMAKAKGENGRSYEYLGNLVKEFHRLGIADEHHCAVYDRIMEIVADRD